MQENHDLEKLFSTVTGIKAEMELEFRRIKAGGGGKGRWSRAKTLEKNLDALKQISSILVSLKIIGLPTIYALPRITQLSSECCSITVEENITRNTMYWKKKELTKLLNPLVKHNGTNKK